MCRGNLITRAGQIGHFFFKSLSILTPGKMQDLRGPTPFEDMIFYLWTDSNEICTAYVKLNSKHILFMRDFRFSF